MLKRLSIRNVALVEELDLAFKPGLNVITGETGAGKSILIGSIGLALGGRAHPDVVGENKSSSEVCFERNGTSRVLRREVRPDGRTRAWIDGENTTIGVLRAEGGSWVEITAQREGATLLDTRTHLSHLDRYAGIMHDVAKMSLLYSKWQSLTSKINSIKSKLRRLAESEELAKFQLEEIESFGLRQGEEDELEREVRLLEGAEGLILGLGKVVDQLDQGEDPLSDKLSQVVRELEDLTSIDDTLKESIYTLSQAVEDIRTAGMDLASRRDEVQLDPERLEAVRVRRDQMIRLARKYGGSVEALFAKWKELQERQNDSGDLEDELKRLESELADHLVVWETACIQLSRKRHDFAVGFEREIEAGLKTVGVDHPEFRVVWTDPLECEVIDFPTLGKTNVTPTGMDYVEYYISFNPGFKAKPMHKVASGGELSRIMLLLKGITNGTDTTPVTIFDEVDTGISGKTARQVGQRLKDLSRSRQVLLVTHLPQIASLADHHIIVRKHTDEESTSVEIHEVEIGSLEHVNEIARLVGGEEITETARATAKELIQG